MRGSTMVRWLVATAVVATAGVAASAVAGDRGGAGPEQTATAVETGGPVDVPVDPPAPIGRYGVQYRPDLRRWVFDSSTMDVH